MYFIYLIVLMKCLEPGTVLRTVIAVKKVDKNPDPYELTI